MAQFQGRIWVLWRHYCSKTKPPRRQRRCVRLFLWLFLYIFSAQIQYVNKFNFSKFKLQLIFNCVVVVCRFHVFVEIFNDWRDKPFFCFETGFKKEIWKKKEIFECSKLSCRSSFFKKNPFDWGIRSKIFHPRELFCKNLRQQKCEKGKK